MSEPGARIQWRHLRVPRPGEPDRSCRSCGRRLFGKSEVCRSRKCPEYSRVWAGDQRQKLFRNLDAFGGQVLVSAVTAPGSDVLPWDECRCAGLGEHKHGGELIWRVVCQVGVVEFLRFAFGVGWCGRLGGWRSGAVRDARSG